MSADQGGVWHNCGHGWLLKSDYRKESQKLMGKIRKIQNLPLKIGIEWEYIYNLDQVEEPRVVFRGMMAIWGIIPKMGGWTLFSDRWIMKYFCYLDKIAESVMFPGWCFGTWILLFHFSIINEIKSFPLTNSIIFQDGHIAPPTRLIFPLMVMFRGIQTTNQYNVLQEMVEITRKKGRIHRELVDVLGGIIQFGQSFASLCQVGHAKKAFCVIEFQAITTASLEKCQVTFSCKLSWFFGSPRNSDKLLWKLVFTSLSKLGGL